MNKQVRVSILAIAIIIIVTSLSIYALNRFAIKSKEKEALPIDTLKVKVETLKSSKEPFEIPVFGVIKPIEEVTISSEINGLIQKKSSLAFSGLQVKKDTILFEIYHKDLEIQKEKIQKSINKKQIESKELMIQLVLNEKELISQNEILLLSEKENERMKNLATGDHVSLNLYEQAKIQYLQTKIKTEYLASAIKINPLKKENIEVSIKEMELQLLEIEEKISKSNVKAPFDGIVKEVFAEMGSIATPGLKLLTMYNSISFEVSVNISKNEKEVLDSCLELDQVKLKLANSDSISGSFHRLEGKVSTSTKMQTAVFRISSYKNLIVGDMVSATILIPTKESYFKINKAFVNDGIISTCVNGKLKRIKIFPRFELKESFVVYDAVKEGDQIITTLLRFIVEDTPLVIYEGLEK